MNTKKVWGLVIAVVVIIGAVAFFTRGASPAPSANSSGGKVVQIVAAENFWGSLVAQIGGSHVQVLSIVSDPNADPHEYESNTTNARAVSQAQYVVENGAGYDAWMDKLLGTNGTSVKTLKVADLIGKKEGDNPHFWYNPEYVNTVIKQMEQDLIALDPTHATDYQTNYDTLQQSLAVYQTKIARIKQMSSGTKVAATEDIFVYLTTATGLDLITPAAFTTAMGDGIDPPAATVATFQDQLKSGQVKVLLYNQQTVTPLTDSLKALAQSKNIPVVGMTETVSPPDATFQDWMGKQIDALSAALGMGSTSQ